MRSTLGLVPPFDLIPRAHNIRRDLVCHESSPWWFSAQLSVTVTLVTRTDSAAEGRTSTAPHRHQIERGTRDGPLSKPPARPKRLVAQCVPQSCHMERSITVRLSGDGATTRGLSGAGVACAPGSSLTPGVSP